MCLNLNHGAVSSYMMHRALVGGSYDGSKHWLIHITETTMSSFQSTVSICYILNSTWIPKVFPSHSRVISIWSPSHPQVLLSTLKYSQVSQVKPDPVHWPPYTWALCIHLSLALSLLWDWFWSYGPVLLPLHSVHSELTYLWASKLLSTYPLSSPLHSCTYINPFHIFGS